MKFIHLTYSLFFICTTIFVSCTKKEEIERTTVNKNEPISNIPSIGFIGITPSAAKQYTDEVTITISYRDGNGDLGENNPDVKNLFVTDSRNQVEYKYRISQLAPDTVPITGNLNIKLNTVALIGTSGANETLSYSIYVKDRAGNKSNTITSSQLIITK